MEKIYYNSDGWVCNRHPNNFPIDDENRFIEVDESESNKTYSTSIGKAWRVVDGNLINDIYSEEEYDDSQIQLIRSIRESLLNAFDIYKTNVSYGVENDENHDQIVAWYRLILDLDENAINNPPEEIKRYL